MNKPFPWLELFIIIAIVAIFGGFLLSGQFILAIISIAVFVFGIVAALCINYADERHRESVHIVNITASLLQQQQDSYTKKIDYLLDRIQTGDAVLSHNLNVPLSPRKQETKTINLPTVDGVMVTEVNG